MSFNFNQRAVNGAKPLANMISNHFLYYPTPSNLNYSWSFGSLAGLFFALQLITGIFLAMHYTPHVEWAFASVEHIMTDVTAGYLFRYFHANGASMIFILIYAHIGRNMYYQSYATRPALWNSGIVIFLLMMATAFIGYVLPWGQMSFWGATVITSLVTAVPFVGEDIAYWVWGGFSINNATLTRFFSLHYLLPFLITGIIGLHLVLLHTDGSSDPLTLAATPGKTAFHPYYTFKDTFIFFVAFGLFGALVSYAPNLLGHSDNFLPANPLVTPAHIVPEWYFTPFYAILRACPNKLGGAIGMFAAILLLLVIPFYINGSSPDARMVFAPFAAPHKVSFWAFVGVFFTLMFLGMRAAEAPYVGASKIFTGLYFSYFLLVLPALAWLNRQLLEATDASSANSTAPTYRQNSEETAESITSSVGISGGALRASRQLYAPMRPLYPRGPQRLPRNPSKPRPRWNFPQSLPVSPVDPLFLLFWTLCLITLRVFVIFARASPHVNFLRLPWKIVWKLSHQGKVLALAQFLYQYTLDGFRMLWQLPWAVLYENFRRLSCLVLPPYESVPWKSTVPTPSRAVWTLVLFFLGFFALVSLAFYNLTLLSRRSYLQCVAHSPLSGQLVFLVLPYALSYYLATR